MFFVSKLIWHVDSLLSISQADVLKDRAGSHEQMDPFTQRWLGPGGGPPGLEGRPPPPPSGPLKRRALQLHWATCIARLFLYRDWTCIHSLCTASSGSIHCYAYWIWRHHSNHTLIRQQNLLRLTECHCVRAAHETSLWQRRDAYPRLQIRKLSLKAAQLGQ